MQVVSVNRAILQHCFSWFVNTGRMLLSSFCCQFLCVLVAMKLWTVARLAFAVQALYKNGNNFMTAQIEFRWEFVIYRTRAVWKQCSTDFTKISSILHLQNSSYSWTAWTRLCKQSYFLPDILHLINQNQELVNKLLISDEAHFHLSGFVNKPISVTGLPQTPQNFMRFHFTLPKSQYGARKLHLEL